MKRLQVGDECYVRGGITGNIYRCKYAGSGFGHQHIAFPTMEGMEAAFFNISKGSPVKLVYPFPCIKEQAT